MSFFVSARSGALALAALAVGLLPPQCAAGFLDFKSAPDLLDELEGALGSHRRSAAESRVADFEEAMRPIFASLPRGRDGRLPRSGVGYLLHRVFVDRHAWYVEGLSSADPAASPAAPIAGAVGNETGALLESRLDRGLTLREAAAFAATLESLVHEETSERMRSAYRALELDAEGDLSEREARLVVDTYMLMFVMGWNHTSAGPRDVQKLRKHINEIYPTWPDTEAWVREVREEVVAGSPEDRTTAAATQRVLEEVANRYGRWQNAECLTLKHELLRYERAGSGRVALKDFYGAAVNGTYQFTEKPEFLRQLGAVDDSNPALPSVIIPNYVNAASNCLAGSKFYSVCCISECEALLRPLERAIAAPEALPGTILELVEQLPSSTVDAPRRLSASMIQRLEEIAAQHGGRVPLHSRLFAQWMHHAYPRECPYPHLAGTTQQMTSRQYRQATSESSALDAAGLRAEADAHELRAAGAEAAEEQELLWTSDQELFVKVQPAAGPTLRLGRGIALALAAGSLAVSLLRSAMGARRTLEAAGAAVVKHTV